MLCNFFILGVFISLSDVRGPKIPKLSTQMFRTKIVHTSGTLFEIVRKKVENYFLTMLPYRVQYNESESDIQIYNFFYKNTPKTKYFQNLEK